MTFINLTPHEITVEVSEGQRLTIPATGVVARVTTKETISEPVDGIETVIRTTGEVVDLPEPNENTTYIVSSMVLSALEGKNRADVVAPDTGPSAVRENGQIKAVRRFVRVV